MKNHLINQTRKSALLLCLLVSLHCRAEQFIELTAEIEISDWGNWFLFDGFARSTQPKTSIFTPTSTVRCVVGTNTWMMTGDFYSNAKATYWFTGANIIQQTAIARPFSDETKKEGAQSDFVALPSLPVEDKLTRTYDTKDGNPGRPVRVFDPFG